MILYKSSAEQRFLYFCLLMASDALSMTRPRVGLEKCEILLGSGHYGSVFKTCTQGWAPNL